MNFQNLHPLSIHFPIAAMFFLFFIDILSLFKKDFSNFSKWGSLLTVIFFIPAILTGFLAADKYLKTDLLILHRNLSLVAAAFAVAYCIIRFTIQKKTRGYRWLFSTFSLFCFASIGVTSEFGGLLYAGHTPFMYIPPIIIERDPYHVRYYSAEEVEKFFESEVSVEEVIPIFKERRCIQCHSDEFEDFYPVNFSKENERGVIWLPRNQEGKLTDWDQSPFYQDVVIKNTMPLDDQGKRIGLPIDERLILFKWLENGAPVNGDQEKKSDSDE